MVRVQGGISAPRWLKDHGRFMPIDVLSLPGSEMLKLSVGAMWPLTEAARKAERAAKSFDEGNPGDEAWLDCTCLAKCFSFCSDTSDNISSNDMQSTLWMIVQKQL